MGHARILPSLDSEGVAIHSSRVSKTVPGISDGHTARNISGPVSPIGSPLLHSRSPQHMSGQMSTSPISSPRTPSGTSTPLTGGSGSIPFHQPKPTTYVHEVMGAIPWSQNSLYSNGSNNSYQDPRPDLFRGMVQASHVFREMVPSENGFLNQFGRTVHGDLRDQYDGQSVLADRVSQQLYHAKLNPSLDLNPGSPKPSRNNGI